MLRYGIKFYTNNGNLAHSEYRDNLYEVLQLCIQNKDVQCKPTLWVLDENHKFLDHTGYVRVHDFQFSQLTLDTYNKYLGERIIDTDDLLNSTEKMKG